MNGGFTSYRISGLEPGNRYTIIVTASNSVGAGPVSNSITGMTTQTSERHPKLVTLTFPYCTYSTAPTRSPTSIRKCIVTASSITVQWGEVPCVHRNGEITGYRLQAVNQSGAVEITANVFGAAREATISGLSSLAQYTVQVAAVNGAGIGPYSNGVSVQTSGKCNHSHINFDIHSVI